MDTITKNEITAKINVSDKTIQDIVETAESDYYFHEFFPKKADRNFSNEEVVKGIQLTLDKCKNKSPQRCIIQDIQDQDFGCACDCEDAMVILQFAKYGEIVYG